MNNPWRYSWHTPRLGLIDARVIILFFVWAFFPHWWTGAICLGTCLILLWAQIAYSMSMVGLFRAILNKTRSLIMGNAIRKRKTMDSALPADYENTVIDDALLETFCNRQNAAFMEAMKKFEKRL